MLNQQEEKRIPVEIQNGKQHILVDYNNEEKAQILTKYGYEISSINQKRAVYTKVKNNNEKIIIPILENTLEQEKATNEIIKKYTAKGYYVTSLTDKEIILYKSNQ